MSITKSQFKNKKKLVFTAVALIMAAVVLAMGSFAWYSLSTNPEISGIYATINGDIPIQLSTDNSTYDYSVKLDIDTEDMAPLTPVSTVDGLNWFVCKYDVAGNVLQANHSSDEAQYKYMRFPNGGNIPASATGSISEVYSYYIYTDIYMKTDMDEADVYLSLPNAASTYQAQDTEKNHYGTYVMSYNVDDNGNVNLLSQVSETSVRIGFMVLGEVTEGDSTESKYVLHPEKYYASSNGTTTLTGSTPMEENRFVIFEPNANLRSYADKESDNYKTDMYISGFAAKTYRYGTGDAAMTYSEMNDYYFPTYPIRATSDTLQEITRVLSKGETGNDEILEWKLDSQTIGDISAGSSSNYVDGSEYRMSASQLLLQRSSTWKYEDPETEKELISADDEMEEEVKTPLLELLDEIINKRDDLDFDSSLLGVMGTFFKASDMIQYNSAGTPIAEGYVTNLTNADYTPTLIDGYANSQARSENKITTLKKDKPQKIRLYFWIEGQDVDCWNDITFSNFMANLEFVAD